MWVVATGFAGTAESCDWELVRVRGELKSCDKMHVLIQGHGDVDDYCAHTAAHHLPDSGHLMIRTLPSRVGDTAQLLVDHGSHVGNGILMAKLPESDSADALTEAVARLTSDCGGAIHRPGEFAQQLSDHEQRLIQTFDPKSVFC